MRFKKIYVEITNYCNKNCSFCSKDNLPKKEMTTSEFEHILKEIKPYTQYIYLHVKGEPLMHNYFKEIIDLCNKYEIKVNITTNGSFLPKQKEILLNPIIRQINISFQSYTNNEIDDILNSVDYICEKNSINFVYRFWALKNNKLSTNNLQLIDKIIEHYKLENSFQKNVYDMQNIEIKKNIYLNKGSIFEWPSKERKKVKDSFCNGLKTHIGILSNGTVVPCCLDSSGIIELGNIYYESLKEILEKERTQKMITSFKNNKCVEELCQKCTYRLNNK